MTKSLQLLLTEEEIERINFALRWGIFNYETGSIRKKLEKALKKAEDNE